MQKKVTVLMSIYKEPLSYLKASIGSILCQTYQDFNLIVIVDNPENVDGIKMLRELAQEDGRLKYYVNTHNIGLALSLNRGIEMIDSKYIARMDADDIAHRDRLEVQMRYCEKNDVALVGAGVFYVDESDNVYRGDRFYLKRYEDIRSALKYGNVMMHPTWFGRTKLFKALFYRDLENSQDMDFICRAIERGYRIENLPNYLLDYRIYKGMRMEKAIRQRVCGYHISKLYKRGLLSCSDIKAITNEALEEIGGYRSRFERGEKLYYAGFREFRQGKFARALSLFCLSAMMTKYQRKAVLSLFSRKIIYDRAYKEEKSIAYEL